VEEGRHAELVKAGGLYQRLYEEQMHYLHGGGMLRIGVDPARLLTIPLFTDMDREALAIVADRFMLERYAAGENVVRQGEIGEKLYIVSRGELEVIVSDGEHEHRLNSLVEGDYFGEMALLSGQPRTATVRTTMPTQLYSLNATDFHTLMERVPSVRDAVSLVVGRRAAALAEAMPTATPVVSGLSTARTEP
jgi:ATP-binding cassette subfamily B protein